MRKLRHMEVKVIWLVSDGSSDPRLFDPRHCATVLHLFTLFNYFLYLLVCFGYCVSPLLKYKLLEDTHLCVFSPVSLST